MKLLVTGATGFTGRYFVEAAAQAGHQPIPLQTNLTDRQALADEVAALEPDAVVHLAAISFVGHKEDSAFYTVNVVGTTNLLASLAPIRKSVKKVLLASSSNVYGNCDASPISEDQSPAPVNHYAASKLAMEYMARTYLDKLPIVITRPFNYTGPGQAANFVIPKLIDHYAHHAQVVELGNLQVEREFNDVRMVCDAYLGLLEYGQPGLVYNVCSGRTYTLQQVMCVLAELSGHTLQAKVNPAFVRANEVYRLCGNPTRLRQVLEMAGRVVVRPSLRETLQWMLASR